MSQISEEAEKAEFREEAHEAESYEAEPHKEHSVNAEKSNELLKAIAKDELTKKLEEAESSKGTEKKSNESELAASAEISMLSNQTNAEQANQLSEKFFHDTEESSEKTSDSVPELGREANIIVRISMVISLVFSLFIIIVLIISYGFGSNSSGSVSSSNTSKSSSNTSKSSSNTSKSSSNTSKSSSMETANAERAETDNTETVKAETSASKPAIDISSEINTLNSTLSEDNFHNFPAAVQDVFDLWCQALEENDKETINEISEHASEWCQLLKEHFSELYILNRVSFTDPDTLTDDEIDLFDSLRTACGKLLNLVNASMLATGKPVLEELSPTVTDIFTQAFYDVTSDAHRYNTCLDEFVLLRYLYEDIFTCDYKLPDSYTDAHASNHPEAFQQGLRDFMKNAQKDDGTLAVFDVTPDFWSGLSCFFPRTVNLGVYWDFGRQDFLRQGRAVLNELAEDRKSEFSALAALAANSLNKDDPDSCNFIDQIIDNYGSQEKLPKGYYVYNDTDGFFGYDDSSLSTTALIVNNDGIYYGELQNGKRSGYGIQFYFRPGYSFSVPPAVYRGSWSEENPNGDGTYYEYQSDKSRRYCISGHWKDGFENGTMTIAEGWRDSERSKQCQYESENGIRTFTGRQTKEGFLIFAENGDWYWFTKESNKDNLYKTPSFLSPRSRPLVGVNKSVKSGQ